ncbi:hypothetical protein ON010_g7535 [Phytophthora cinnamomi]|nr:hypothetical protein ON010_g7535 [Phytophthora cinnamomi]
MAVPIVPREGESRWSSREKLTLVGLYKKLQIISVLRRLRYRTGQNLTKPMWFVITWSRKMTAALRSCWLAVKRYKTFPRTSRTVAISVEQETVINAGDTSEGDGSEGRAGRGRRCRGESIGGGSEITMAAEVQGEGGALVVMSIAVEAVIIIVVTKVIATPEHEATVVKVHFRGSNSDQSGKGEARILERSNTWWACPVRAAWLLAQHRGRKGIAANAPICSGNQNEFITAANMTRAIKNAAIAAGEDPDHYGTHSMHSGGATELFIAGVDHLAIKNFGLWKSDTYEQYTRIDGQTVSGLAASIIPGDSEGH